MHNGKEYSLRRLAAELKNISPADLKIVDARCDSKRIVELDEADRKIAAAQIVFTGTCLTGCNTPSTDAFMDALCEEILIFITEFGYSDLTEEEINLSLRINCKGGYKFESGLDIRPIQFTGYTFNVNFLADVLSNYISIRKMLDRKFQNFIDGY